MKISLKSGILLILSVCIARIAFYYFSLYPSAKISEDKIYKVVEIASGIGFLLVIAYFIARKRSEQFQRNAFAIVLAIVIAMTANGMIDDYKQIQTIKALRSNALASMTGDEIREIGNTSELAKATNELFKLVKDERQKLDLNEEAIKKLFPQTLQLEIFTSSEKLVEARSKLDEIEKLTKTRVEAGQNWYQNQIKMIEQLETKYKVKMDEIKNALLRGKNNTEKYFMPVQNEMMQMVATVKEVHKFAQQQNGRAAIQNGQIYFESDEAVKTFNKLSQRLQNENEKLKQLQGELAKHTEQTIDSVANPQK